MKNKNYNLLLIFFLIIFINTKVNSNEQFNFDVTNVEILENGKIFKGLNEGVATSNNGIVISAGSFEYNKETNILIAKDDVKMEDTIENYTIFSDQVTYFKNDEKILTKGNSKASYINGQLIHADSFEYNKETNILIAKDDVKMEDTIENYTIFSDQVTYFKNDEKILTKGKTKSLINNKYEILSKNVLFLINKNLLSSKERTTIKDKNSNFYQLDEFELLKEKDELRGNKILAISNFGSSKSDKIYFSSAIIDLNTKNYLAKDTKIKIHKDIFNNPENDPRLVGLSSSKNGDITIVNKGIFTSCGESDKCPPWSIKAEEIKHDREKKQLIYKNAFLKIYDLPVLYFPKFFHPDPTVKRQSGFLQPKLGDSDILGSSATIPYFYVKNDSTDFTFTPTFFDKNTKMLQTEFRKVGNNYNFISDFGFINNYKSSIYNKKKNMSHFFGKFDKDLELENFNSSNLSLSIERITNDTYLKVFDENIVTKTLKPNNYDVLNSELKISFNHDNYNLNTGLSVYEDLQRKESDRYQYILPYYNYSQILSKNYLNGSLSLLSEGNNQLKNTNNLRSLIVNDISYRGFDKISNLGLKNNINIYLKNLNSAGKNDLEYTSSPQIDLMGNFEFTSKLPLVKKTSLHQNLITPTLSFRFNPNDMKNYSTADKKINVDNIFYNNRIGINDSMEAGRSLTLGINYKKEKIEDINKYFELKLATSIRDKEEKNLPKKSTLNRKNSNLFGSLTNNFSDHIVVDYNFAIDNDLSTFEYNELNAQLSINNFVTDFSFIEENGEMGDANVIENSFKYIIDKNNNLSFKTRRNRKLNLTEYYDLVYEYKNDCLTAGIKYKKTYYEDRDLIPSENLFFTITLFPLTIYETGNLR